MEVVIVETKRIERTVDLKLPYYFKQDFFLDNCDSVLYGKVGKNKTVTIMVTDRYLENIFEYEVSVHKCHPDKFTCYYKDENISTAAEYEAARQSAIKAIKGE